MNSPERSDTFAAIDLGSNSFHLLVARRMRGTHQLIEWIMGRLDRVEVVAPTALRNYIMERLDAMQARYT